MALAAGVESAVRLHVNRGDNVNGRDARGQTPLMIAAGRNRPSICRILLEAGADAAMQDSTGMNAHGIALAAGALEAATVLAAALPCSAACPSSPDGGTDGNSGHTEGVISGPVFEVTVADPATGAAIALPADHPETAEESPQPDDDGATAIDSDLASYQAVASWDDGEEGDPELDIGSWIAEAATVPPENDAASEEAVTLLQKAIGTFVPRDNDADWGDIELELPEQAAPLLRTDDEEQRAALRKLILRALREGSVPAHLVEDLSVGGDREQDPEAHWALRMTLNDLGAEIDERVECVLLGDDFRVVVDEQESEDEAQKVSDAIAHFESRASDRNAPMRFYAREQNRQNLITADEEVALAQAMESSVEAALDALACWPKGVERILDAASSAARGVLPLESIAVLTAGEADDEEVSESDEDEPDTSSVSDEEGAFHERAKQLALLHSSDATGGPTWHAMRMALAELGLRKSFLLGLADDARRDSHHSASRFVKAADAFLCAREQLTLANLKLVRSIAAKYLFHSGMPMDDLIQEGNLGLLKAVEKYDWRRGFRFSTYATWWIRQAVSRTVANDSRLIRVPVHLHENVRRTEKAVADFERSYHREPTIDELSTMMSIPAKKVAALVRSSQPAVSLNTSGIEEAFAADYVQNMAAPDPSAGVEARELNQVLSGLMAGLGRKTEQILRARFGFEGDPMTLDEIGGAMGVTRERVRQIEAKALRQLQHPSRAGALHAWAAPNDEEPAARTFAVMPKQSAEPLFSIPDLIGDEEAPALTGVPPQPRTAAPAAARVSAAVAAPQTVPASPSEPEAGVLRSSAHQKLVKEAEAAGVAVYYDRADGAGYLEFRVREPWDGRTRSLIRKLVLMGFEQTATGYRK